VVVRLGTVQVSPRDAARLARIVDVLLADADDPNVAALSNDLGQNHRTTESGEAVIMHGLQTGRPQNLSRGIFCALLI
jgi:hypothetical protein